MLPVRPAGEIVRSFCECPFSYGVEATHVKFNADDESLYVVYQRMLAIWRLRVDSTRNQVDTQTTHIEVNTPVEVEVDAHVAVEKRREGGRYAADLLYAVDEPSWGASVTRMDIVRVQKLPGHVSLLCLGCSDGRVKMYVLPRTSTWTPHNFVEEPFMEEQKLSSPSTTESVSEGSFRHPEELYSAFDPARY